jgi:phosphoglycerol transferase MdoB-like AlkP superfamily enzyme
MSKQRQQSLVKRYVSFFAFCVIILLIGVIASIPIKVEVHSVGEKPPFLFALLFSVLSLATAIGAAYLSYLYWFQGEKTRTGHLLGWFLPTSPPNPRAKGDLSRLAGFSRV